MALHKQPRNKPNIYEDLQDKGCINARVIDARSGLQVIGGVYAVRIHSSSFYALLMNDYMPTIGQVDGDVIFLNQSGEHPFRGIRGFYKHQHNEFTLLIEEHKPPMPTGEAEAKT